MEDWKAAHDEAKKHIAALEAAKERMRDEAIKAIRERDEWKRKYEELKAEMGAST
jgi:hypothetical protein